VPSGAGQYRFVRVIPVLIFPGARSCVGFVLPAKRQVIPRSRGTGPEPAVPAWAHGTDGVGPAPAVPRRRAGPVAADGRLRIRHPRRPGPPALAGRPLGVNEWRPQTWRETLASPMEEI